MRAAVFYGAGDIRVQSVDPPAAPGPGELVLRVRACGICGSDLHEYHNGPIHPSVEPHPLTGAALPQILGHELAGEIVELGRGVSVGRVGDRVSVMPLFYCGRCHPCTHGRPQSCRYHGAVGYNWPWGGMGELAIVKEHQVAVLPDEVSTDEGALVEPSAVALHAVSRAGVAPGDVVLVTGAGPIGQLVSLGAACAGASTVIVVEPSAPRRAAAQDLGLGPVFDPSTVDPAAEVLVDHPEGVDVAIECAGVQPALDTCLAVIQIGGTILQTALHLNPVELDPLLLTRRDVSLIGAACFPVTAWPRVIGLIQSGRLAVTRVITSRVSLENVIKDGFDRLSSQDSDQVKVLVEL